MSQTFKGAAWIVGYLLAAAAPLFFAVFNDAPPARGFWHDLSVSLGFIGLAMFGAQFALTARFKQLTSPFGMDVVVQFHRQISYVATAFVLAHPALMFLTDAPMGELLNPITAPWRARFGLLAIVLLLALIGTSAWRERIGLRYETWRLLHGIFAVLVVAFSLIHVQLVGYYVAQPWKQVLWAFMSIAVVGLLLHVRVLRPLRLRRHPFEIEEVVAREGDAYSVVLRPVGHEGMRFRPGQFAWLSVGDHPFGLEQHPFSFSSSADEPERIELTIKALGDFSSGVGQLAPGTRAYLDGPYGVFTTELNEAPGFLFVVGGIGVTPVVSMLRTLADRGDRRPCRLLYGVEAVEDATFAEELEDLATRLDLEVVLVPNEPPEGWTGASGFIDAALLDEHLPPQRERVQCFICGPTPMMDAVERALRQLGVPEDHVNLERFAFA